MSSKLLLSLTFFLFLSYLVYISNLVSFSTWLLPSCANTTTTTAISSSNNVIQLLINNASEYVHHIHAQTPPSSSSPPHETPTQLQHIVFGIAASAKLWETRKNYVKSWWKPNQSYRGYVWLDKQVKINHDDNYTLPPLKISADTSRFPYNNRLGNRSAIRISRIVSEMVRLGLEDVRWFVMGDDDTVFVVDNLVRVLRKYDHKQMYYIGSVSESHIQNIGFSYGMAYGGGGFAISYGLAKQVEKMQDRCIHRYPELYGSDDRMQACMAEIGVPLTKEPGFHQFDVYGNLLGLLTAHPVAPLVSLHHLDIVDPIFPNMTRIQSLNQLAIPTILDSAALMQQAICYDKTKTWTISSSWGYAVQIYRGYITPRELEKPSRTFLNWYKRADHMGFSFNTRPVSRNQCQKPSVYYLSKAWHDPFKNLIVTEYVKHWVQTPACRWKVPDPGVVDRVLVYKRPDPHLWEKAPRRNCCRVLPSTDSGSISLDVGVCRDSEISEI